MREIIWNEENEVYTYGFIAQLMVTKPPSIPCIFSQLQKFDITLNQPPMFYSPTTSPLGFVAAILSPTVSSLHLTLPKFNSAAFEEASMLLNDLPAYCPQAKSIEYTYSSWSERPEADKDLLRVILRGWKNVTSITLNESNFQCHHLTLLSELSDLSKLVCTDDIPPEAVPVGVVCNGSFSSLTTISLNFSKAETAITFLQLIHLADLRVLHIGLPDNASSEELISITNSISKMSGTLLDLHLRAAFLAYENVLGISDCYRLKTLRCSINCGNANIDHLAQHLPNLENLDLHKTDFLHIRRAWCKLDLTCMVSLARYCKKLKRVVLTLDPNRIIPQSWGSLPFPHLEELQIFYDEVHYPNELAVFLSMISLTTLRITGPPYDFFDGDEEPSWTEMRKLVPLLQFVRAQERRSATAILVKANETEK